MPRMAAPEQPMSNATRPPEPDHRQGAGRALERCHHLAEFSDEPGRITRRFLTPATSAAQSTLGRWFAAAGLNVLIDAAGNLIGHRRATATPVDGSEPRTLLLGSHLDSVPDSGPFDGVLGILAALEVIDLLGDTPLPFHVDLVATSEEGGVRFGLPYVGSRALTGALPGDILTRRDADGISMRAAIETFGLNPDSIAAAAYDPDRLIGYVEAHIEQGPVLNAADAPLGIVTGIQGQSRILLRFTGRSGHAGTVPMDQRNDALVAAARLIVETQDYGRSIDGLRATAGMIDARPNVRNVIPGEVDLSMDVRHNMDEIREIAVAALLEMADAAAREDGLICTVLEHQTTPAQKLSAPLSARLGWAVRQTTGSEPRELPSGSGHDAVVFATHCPAAMLFIRQRDDLTDRSAESIDPDDLAHAIATLHHFTANLDQTPDVHPDLQT